MLLEDLVDQLLIFDGHGRVRHFFGKYSDWLAAQKAAAATSPPAMPKPKAKPAPAPAPATVKATTASPGGAVTKLNQRALEERMARTEAELADIDQQLADPDIYRDGDRVRALQKRRSQLAKELAPLEEEWLRRGTQAE
jgi:hypothetical protein